MQRYLGEDYIVKRDTYNPYDGVTLYEDVPRTMIMYYDEETHIIIGSVRCYTFSTEAMASDFYSNIDNPDATRHGNIVYIKKMIIDSQNTWNSDSNDPGEVL